MKYASADAVFLSVSGALVAVAVSCASSNFSGQSAAAKKSTSPSSSSEVSNAPAPTTSTTASNTSPAAPTSAASGGSVAFNANAFAVVSAADATTVGCALPANVASAMSGFVAPVSSQTAQGGSGWSTAAMQSSLGLINLDLDSCQWFQKLKGTETYVVLFTNAAKTQSYAQPFALGANAVTYAACIAAATAASATVGGGVSCDYMPY